MYIKFIPGRAATAAIIGVMALTIGQPASAAEVTVDFDDLTGLPTGPVYGFFQFDTHTYSFPVESPEISIEISGGWAVSPTAGNNVYGGFPRKENGQFTCYKCAGGVSLIFSKAVAEVTIDITNPHSGDRSYDLIAYDIANEEFFRTSRTDKRIETAIIPGNSTLKKIKVTAAELGEDGLWGLRVARHGGIDRFYIDNIVFDDGTVADELEPNIVSFRAFIPGDNAPAAPDVSCVALPEATAGRMAKAPAVVRGVSSSPDSAERRGLYVAGDGDGSNSHRAFQSVAVFPNRDDNADGFAEDSIKNETADMNFYAENALSGNKFSSLALADAKGGDCHWYHQTHALPSDKMEVKATRTGSDSVSVRFSGSVDTPLGGKAGKDALDWDVTVTLDADGAWKVFGKHDRFPAYAVYIDGTEIYASDPGDGIYSSYNAEIRKQIRSMDVAVDEASAP